MDKIKSLIKELQNNNIRLWIDGESLKFGGPKGALTNDLKLKLKENKEEIIKLLKSEENKSEEEIFPVEISDKYETSIYQKTSWYLHEISPGSSSRHNVFRKDVPEDLSIEQIHSLFDALISRHEGLRTVFLKKDEELFQIVKEDVSIEVHEQTLPSESMIKQYSKIFAKAPFNLEEGPLFRVALVSGNGIKTLIFCIHEIISDGSTFWTLKSDVDVIVKSFQENKTIDLSPLDIQYKDFSVWHNALLESSVGVQNMAYWKNKMSGTVSRTFLPYSFESDGVAQGRQCRFSINNEVLNSLKLIASSNSTSVYVLLQTALACLLYKVSGQQNIIFATALSNRGSEKLKDVIGFFITTLFLRHDVECDDTLSTLLARVKTTTVEALLHRDYDVDKLLDQIDQQWEPGRFVVTPILINYLNFIERNVKVLPEGYNFSDMGHDPKAEMEMYVYEYPNGLEFVCDYRSDLFSEETVQEFFSRFLLVLEKTCSDINESLNDINLRFDECPNINTNYLSAAKGLHQELKFNNIVSWFEQQEQLKPNAQAIDLCGESKGVTYTELSHLSHNICYSLLERGVESQQPIGIAVVDPLIKIASMIAVMKIGAIFCFIEPESSNSRIKKQLEVISPALVITDMQAYKHVKNVLCETQFPKLLLTRDNNDYDLLVDEAVVQLNNQNLDKKQVIKNYAYGYDEGCYIYFTSGSTGEPKPILGRMQGVLQFIQWELSEFKIADNIKVSQLSSCTFDAYLRDVFLPLCAGGTIISPPDPKAIVEPEVFYNWVTDSSINLIHCTPTIFRQLLQSELTPDSFPALRYILLSGEPILPSDVSSWHKVFGNRIELVNLYGPSETTMVRCFHRISLKDGNASFIPAGKSIPGTSILLVNDKKGMCGHEEPGEIYIGSPYSSLGYFQQSELTKNAFFSFDNVNSTDADTLFYRTGDMGMLSTSGDLRILGRTDRQVKINGVRIEPQEIEDAVLSLEGVTSAAVNTYSDKNMQVHLWLYYVGEPLVDDVKVFLVSNLPSWLVPGFIKQLDKLPKTSSNKVDYQALPKPETFSQDDENEFPESKTEKALAEIWKELLGKDKVFKDDNFFELGGHSLKAILLISRIKRMFEVEVIIQDIFLNGKLKALAKKIDYLVQQSYVFRKNKSSDDDIKNKNKNENRVKTETGIF